MTDGKGLRRVRLLRVEDNEDAAIAMAMSLESIGDDVIHGPTLREAVAFGTQQVFDVIVTDRGLRHRSGSSSNRCS